ncbi:hypothetical protein BHM03_00049535 [Ensete ventricosum]|nr:hypothetical protein BHM03_00049535 [Ensete ventricosum]
MTDDRASLLREKPTRRWHVSAEEVEDESDTFFPWRSPSPPLYTPLLFPACIVAIRSAAATRGGGGGAAYIKAGKETAMASVKETAENVAASATSGMDKTKATVQEKWHLER